MIRVPLPGGGVAEVREPAPVDLEVHGFGNDGDIAAACIRTIDGQPVKADELTVMEQQAIVLAVESFLRPSAEQAAFLDANWREASRRSALLALPSTLVCDSDGKFVDAKVWIEIGHPTVAEMNDAMEGLERVPQADRRRAYQQALMRLMVRCIRSVTKDGARRPVTVADLFPWPWTTLDYSVAAFAFLTVCQLTDGQKAAILAGIEVAA